MKLSVYLVFCVALLPATCSAAAFNKRRAHLFGVPRGGSKQESEEEKRVDDYEAAEKRIFEAEKRAVEVVEKAIEDEVGTLYHELPHHEMKEADLNKKKKAVNLTKRDEDDEKQDDYEVAQDKIFHAMENVEKTVISAAHKAEQAVEHAIQEEVETLFPDGHDDEKS